MVRGAAATKPLLEAFEHYWKHDSVKTFGATGSAEWVRPWGCQGIDAKVSFSPSFDQQRAAGRNRRRSRRHEVVAVLFPRLLYQTTGLIRDAIENDHRRQGRSSSTGSRTAK